MKLAILIVLLSVLPVALFARDLVSAARKEKARRAAIAATGRHGASYTDDDLERHAADALPVAVGRREATTLAPTRDLEKERAFWIKEKRRHEQELARIDARIQRLEWRLAERKSRVRPGERLREDTVRSMLEDSLETLRDERSRLIEDFLERARKARAFPGWLR